MALRMTKPWHPGDQAQVILKGHMGVFQLADDQQQVRYIGYAGGKSLFGLKGEVTQALDEFTQAKYFRVEITTSYLSRFRELMMVHIADFGAAPQLNPPIKLGRLSPGQA